MIRSQAAQGVCAVPAALRATLFRPTLACDKVSAIEFIWQGREFWELRAGANLREVALFVLFCSCEDGYESILYRFVVSSPPLSLALAINSSNCLARSSSPICLYMCARLL